MHCGLSDRLALPKCVSTNPTFGRRTVSRTVPGQELTWFLTNVISHLFGSWQEPHYTSQRACLSLTFASLDTHISRTSNMYTSQMWLKFTVHAEMYMLSTFPWAHRSHETWIYASVKWFPSVFLFYYPIDHLTVVVGVSGLRLCTFHTGVGSVGICIH